MNHRQLWSCFVSCYHAHHQMRVEAAYICCRPYQSSCSLRYHDVSDSSLVPRTQSSCLLTCLSFIRLFFFSRMQISSALPSIHSLGGISFSWVLSSCGNRSIAYSSRNCSRKRAFRSFLRVTNYSTVSVCKI